MSLTSKALFIIERNLNSDLSLSRVAEHCGASRFHLARAFGEATGYPLMGYVRGRRLTEAARKLAAGAEDILMLALDQHYASHEAFSRAFKSRFGKSPEEVRNAQSTAGLSLIEPLRHREGKIMKLKQPRIQKGGELLFVGLSQTVCYQEIQKIAPLWQKFMSASYFDVENKKPEPPVGITTAADDEGINYVCAAGVTRYGKLPDGCIKVTLPPTTYVVFAHDEHIAKIRETYDAIWNGWFPNSATAPAEAPGFERHNPSFDPRTGDGGVTIWLPIRT